ncbi:CdiA family toxin C-terminal domain-containing protein [Cellvibrio mixtus]|uniref:CdiA family toxin C-terminal domain-containing protein n=1 Tax=Cellvibrio mixtus TaxID=39650 RepID=UPI001269ACAD|nr:CdiA family toxin C-terminal domain-containing protein [Cellvibrio mixtus]
MALSEWYIIAIDMDAAQPTCFFIGSLNTKIYRSSYEIIYSDSCGLFSSDLNNLIHAGVDPSGKIIGAREIEDNQGRVVGYEYTYKFPKIHGDGPNANQIIVENGVISYKQADKPKAVYDPKIISDTEYLQMITRVGKAAYSENRPHFVRNDQMDFRDSQTGLNFSVRIKWDNGTPVVENVHLIK